MLTESINVLAMVVLGGMGNVWGVVAGALLLSFVPDLTFGFGAVSAASLIALHAVAASIVVPTLAGRLVRAR